MHKAFGSPFHLQSLPKKERLEAHTHTQKTHKKYQNLCIHVTWTLVCCSLWQNVTVREQKIILWQTINKKETVLSLRLLSHSDRSSWWLLLLVLWFLFVLCVCRTSMFYGFYADWIVAFDKKRRKKIGCCNVFMIFCLISFHFLCWWCT